MFAYEWKKGGDSLNFESQSKNVQISFSFKSELEIQSSHETMKPAGISGEL